MKIYVEMIAYNEADLIEKSIRSTYDYVDEIIVVDGSQWGPSTDSTAKLAKSVGPKVKVSKGTFKDEAGKDHLGVQRNFGLDQMEKSRENWCISQDADEVFDKASIEKLTSRLRRGVFPNALLVRYPNVAFWVDDNHISKGFPWDKMRQVCTFRLVPGVRWLNYHRVGVVENGKEVNFLSLKRQVVVWNDVKYFHYGYATSLDKYREKSYRYFHRDVGFRKGYSLTEWEKFWTEVELPKWERRLTAIQSLPYRGPRP